MVMFTKSITRKSESLGFKFKLRAVCHLFNKSKISSESFRPSAQKNGVKKV